MGSVRAGAATAFYLFTEDGERSRMRGRWLNAKMMNIYIQEVMATTFLSDLPAASREQIHVLSAALPAVAAQVSELLLQRTLPVLWPRHFETRLL